MTLNPFTTELKTLGPTRNISITSLSFMKFCPVVPEICRGQVHGPRKERRKRIRITRYDYTLTIMESPKPATDNRFKK
jgi:hypothetical protein